MKVDSHGVKFEMGIGSNTVLGRTYFEIQEKDGARVYIHKNVICHILSVLQRDMKKMHNKRSIDSLLDLLDPEGSSLEEE